MRQFALCLLVATLWACSESSPPAVTAENGLSSTRVVVTSPQRRSIDHVLTALGSVESIHHPTISAETSGQVISIEIKEGDFVEARQLIAVLDNTLHEIEADKASADLRRQEILLDNQQREVKRLLKLAETQSVARDHLEDEQAQLAMLAALRDVASKQRQQALYLASKTKIMAPLSGLISKRHVSVGDYVTPGQALFNLVSIDTLRARLAFPEHQAASISVGKQVSLSTPAVQEGIAIGTVTSINPQIDPRSRVIDVIVEFANPGGWYPGASVDASLIVKRIEDALLIPTISVVKRSGSDVVFVVDGEYARQRPVVQGWREQGLVEIVSGLSAQDQVVTEGSAHISDGSRLTVSGEEPAL
jgi:RND family efflux transporter MFP subunit